MKNYLITGVSSDIGLALFQHLDSDKNCEVLGICRSSRFPEEINKENIFSGIDLLNTDHLKRLEEKIKSTFNSPFILIHCVGDFWVHKSLEKTTYDEGKSQVLSHYLTLLNTIKTVTPSMKKFNGGKIIAFSCNSVSINYPDMSPFTASKSAVESLIKCTANELSKYNISANALALSTIRTKKVIDEKKEKYHDDYMSLNELIESILHVSKSPVFLNGNIIKLFKYSKFYYTEGYYERNIVEK